MEELILVDANDQEIGVMEKMEAHEKGLLHRAFSILLFNTKGELLLQQRALEKYHSPGLWTNTCCSHPRPNERTADAAHRRLFEEMGMKAELNEAFHFTYRAALEHGLIEHEIDHVFIGYTEESPQINTSEVMAFQWISLEDIQTDIQKNPNRYTAWFKLLMEDHYSSIQQALIHESK